MRGEQLAIVENSPEGPRMLGSRVLVYRMQILWFMLHGSRPAMSDNLDQE